MKHGAITKAELKAKSEEQKISFPNLLSGYLLEELMYLISESEYAECLWLKNSSILGIEQYQKKENSLTLDFAYVTDENVVKKGELRPGQSLSLKLAYMMLLQFLQKEKTPKIKWKGKVLLRENGAEFEIIGEFEEMTVPICVKITEIQGESSYMPEKKEFLPFMGNGNAVSYLEYPDELYLSEALGLVLKHMELLSDMGTYLRIYDILSETPMDGRHIRETLALFCQNHHISLEEERLEELLAYREYGYMNKKWEKYLRHCGKKAPIWQEVVDKLSQFLSPIWSAICRDEVFFGDWMPELGRFLD